MKKFFKKISMKEKIIMKETEVQTDVDLLSCKCRNKELIINCNKIVMSVRNGLLTTPPELQIGTIQIVKLNIN